jgi:hypothetical protein
LIYATEHILVKTYTKPRPGQRIFIGFGAAAAAFSLLFKDSTSIGELGVQEKAPAGIDATAGATSQCCAWLWNT